MLVLNDAFEAIFAAITAESPVLNMLDLRPANHKHMLITENMLKPYTWAILLIGQDMLIGEMLITMFYCIYFAPLSRLLSPASFQGLGVRSTRYRFITAVIGKATRKGKLHSTCS